MIAVLEMNGVELGEIRDVPAKDSRGQVTGVKRYVDVLWMGDKANLLLDNLVQAESKIFCNLRVEGQFQTLIRRYGEQERTVSAFVPRHIIFFQRASLPGIKEDVKMMSGQGAKGPDVKEDIKMMSESNNPKSSVKR